MAQTPKANYALMGWRGLAKLTILNSTTSNKLGIPPLILPFDQGNDTCGELNFVEGVPIAGYGFGKHQRLRLRSFLPS